MKISDALERASSVVPQIRGRYFQYVDGNLCACMSGMVAIGARMGGNGSLPNVDHLDVSDTFDSVTDGEHLKVDFEQLPDDLQSYYRRKCTYTDLGVGVHGALIALNDHLNWTPTMAIAWLRSIGL